MQLRPLVFCEDACNLIAEVNANEFPACSQIDVKIKFLLVFYVEVFNVQVFIWVQRVVALVARGYARSEAEPHTEADFETASVAVTELQRNVYVGVNHLAALVVDIFRYSGENHHTVSVGVKCCVTL